MNNSMRSAKNGASWQAKKPDARVIRSEILLLYPTTTPTRGSGASTLQLEKLTYLEAQWISDSEAHADPGRVTG